MVVRKNLSKILPPSRRWVLVALGVLLCSGALGLLIVKRHVADHPLASAAFSTYGKGDGAGAYAGSSNCKTCHEEEYEQWERSHHGLAQRAPNAKLDGSAFEPARSVLESAHPTAVRKIGPEFQVLTAGLTGTQEVFAVAKVIGESPLRQFLLPFSGGRWQTLDASYDPHSNEWFNVFGSEDRRVGDWGHWTGRGMNWNSMCASCHNTWVQKNYEAASDSYHTRMVEESVGCEACHGPLREHDQWQQKFGRSKLKDPTLPRLSRRQQVDNCGFCHARRGELTGEFKPGEDFFDHLRLEIVNASETYYADGQVHEEDYEYAAFLGSRMHWRGVNCSDCHNPHSARTILPGNWLCMRCHNGNYTNAPSINPVTHSHHQVFGYNAQGAQVNADLMSYQSDKVKETGGECVNCHMPQTVYMQRHRRHDHGFTIPDPLLTKRAGIPNACSRCHVDKDADWALRYCAEWYGPKMDRPQRQRALLFASARQTDPLARAGLLRMLATNEIPYWRAASGGLLQPWAGDPQVRDGLLAALTDPEALVRMECVRALEPSAQAPVVAGALSRSLADPVRGVRLAAAWAMRSSLDLSSKAAAELQHCLAINADQPAGQVQLGAFALARGDPAQALACYRKAEEWDPNSAAIRHDYALVLSTVHRPQEALEQLQEACRLEPTNAQFQYSLALAWNELGQTAKTIEFLQLAIRLEPSFARAWYNLGLALNSTGRTAEALDDLIRAESADALDPRIPYARATIFAQIGNWAQAQRAAERALEIEPGFEPAQQLVQTARQARAHSK